MVRGAAPPPPKPDAFASAVAERIGCYVYLLIDPRDGQLFYVGKGTGDRCFAHLAEARETPADAVGDYAKLARIREIEATGASVGIDLLRHGLTEREAFLVESAAINLLGLAELANRVAGYETAERGRMSVADVNALYGARPVAIDPEHRVVLIRINRLFERGMTDAALYEATRKWWKVGAWARQLGAPSAPEWAMAVFGGVVRALYRIEAWEPATAAEIADDPKRSGRWKFRGRRDAAMEALYLHGDVSGYLGVSQNPILYEPRRLRQQLGSAAGTAGSTTVGDQRRDVVPERRTASG